MSLFCTGRLWQSLTADESGEGVDELAIEGVEVFDAEDAVAVAGDVFQRGEVHFVRDAESEDLRSRVSQFTSW